MNPGDLDSNNLIAFLRLHFDLTRIKVSFRLGKILEFEQLGLEQSDWVLFTERESKVQVSYWKAEKFIATDIS